LGIAIQPGLLLGSAPATDTPTMSFWGLFALAMLLVYFAKRYLNKPVSF
jgi:hypothetical protein